MKSIVILGASNKPERVSNQVIKMLQEYGGFRVLPVHPRLKEVEGLETHAVLDDISEHVDILSVYVRPEIFEELLDHVADLKPGYVILNPGTESPAVEMGLERRCIPYHKACTMVLLKEGKL